MVVTGSSTRSRHVCPTCAHTPRRVSGERTAAMSSRICRNAASSVGPMLSSPSVAEP